MAYTAPEASATLPGTLQAQIEAGKVRLDTAYAEAKRWEEMRQAEERSFDIVVAKRVDEEKRLEEIKIAVGSVNDTLLEVERVLADKLKSVELAEKRAKDASEHLLVSLQHAEEVNLATRNVEKGLIKREEALLIGEAALKTAKEAFEGKVNRLKDVLVDF